MIAAPAKSLVEYQIRTYQPAYSDRHAHEAEISRTHRFPRAGALTIVNLRQIFRPPPPLGMHGSERLDCS